MTHWPSFASIVSFPLGDVSLWAVAVIVRLAITSHKNNLYFIILLVVYSFYLLMRLLPSTT